MQVNKKRVDSCIKSVHFIKSNQNEQFFSYELRKCLFVFLVVPQENIRQDAAGDNADEHAPDGRDIKINGGAGNYGDEGNNRKQINGDVGDNSFHFSSSIFWKFDFHISPSWRHKIFLLGG